MITKREKLQYIYVFLTDLVVLLLSTLLAWLVTDGLLKQLVPYAPSDWVQTICLLMLAFVATFICFDQTENIVTRTSGEEIKLSIKFNVLLALVYSTAMLLTKATMLDSRYFTLAVPLINFVLQHRSSMRSSSSRRKCTVRPMLSISSSTGMKDSPLSMGMST